MKFLNFLVLFILISCAGPEVQKKDVEDAPYRTSGVEQFFLPELPAWANFSASGKCTKSMSFIYLDFDKLAGAYQLTYPQMLELQAQYNERLENYFRSTAVKFLKPVEEAGFFSNTLEQVRGGVRHFQIPKVSELELIWLDGYLQENKAEEIKKMASSGRFDQKLPVLFSSCLSRGGMNQWISENNLEQAGFYLLSAEWLSPFNSEHKLIPGLQVDVKKLLDFDARVSILTPTPALVPTEILNHQGEKDVRNAQTGKK